MLKTGGYQSGDLAVAAHHFPRTDSDDDSVAVISDNAGGDEESSEQEIHDVPMRRQLAEQRSRCELFRRPRNRFKTSKHLAQVRPMVQLVVTRRFVLENKSGEHVECLRPRSKIIKRVR